MFLGQLRVPFLRFVGHVNTKTNIADKTLSNNALLETNSFLIQKKCELFFYKSNFDVTNKQDQKDLSNLPQPQPQPQPAHSSRLGLN